MPLSFLNRRFPGLFQNTTFQYTSSIVFVSLVSLLSLPLAKTESYPVVSYILLFVVSILATFLGTGPVLLAAASASLIWNYFFIPPHFTFHIDKAEDILMFTMFFIIALVNGVFTTRVRHQEQLARDREHRTKALFNLTRELSAARGLKQVCEVAEREIWSVFEVKPLFSLEQGNFDLHQPRVMQLDRPVVLKGEKQALWDNFLTQISNALQREYLDEQARRVRYLSESAHLYKTMFNSLSHEFRIPVATILGASDTLSGSPQPEEIQQELYFEIQSAALRLNRLLENLLNMSRLESGLFKVKPDWCDINDLINHVREESGPELMNFRFTTRVPESMHLVKIDFGLMEQVLYNLFMNTIQYCPAGSQIFLSAACNNGTLTLELMDEGPGMPDGFLNDAFEKFHRLKGNQPGGLGLGLSIVKGFVEAHQGHVTLKNREGGGLITSIVIPVDSLPLKENMQYEGE